jgi:hypothetical protein
MDFDRSPLLFAAKSSVADPFQSMGITSGANRNDPRPPDPAVCGRDAEWQVFAAVTAVGECAEACR